MNKGDYAEVAMQLIKNYYKKGLWEENVECVEKLMEYFYLSGHGIKGLSGYLEGNPTEAEIKELFLKDLTFGTAGLRAEMGVGFNRMNLVSVALASMGIGAYLREELGLVGEGGGGSVLIGYDHRHNSYAFAQVSKKIFEEYGHRVRLFEEAVPTPYVPSGIRCLGADFGIMVTASHNPKEYNGYKVYHRRGAQIQDTEASKILKWIQLERIARKQTIPKLESQEAGSESESERGLIERVEEWYIAHLKKSLPFMPEFNSHDQNCKFMYTAMHGVGAKYVERVFTRIFPHEASRGDLCFVQEQRYPDPDFPTVKYPNPEEGRETLKLAIESAEREGIDIIFANDPDADRFLVAERSNRSNSDNNSDNDSTISRAGWRIFSGNETATLLLDHILKTEETAASRKGNNETCVVLASCVSSRYLGKMCEKMSLRFETTQIGFKNLGNRGLELEDGGGCRVLMAYEEAIGFQIGDWNFDKDGISTLMSFYTLLRRRRLNEGNKSIGVNLVNRLESIYKDIGYFPMQCNGYFLCNRTDRIKEIVSKAQENAMALIENSTKMISNLNLMFKPHDQQQSRGVVSIEFNIGRGTGTETEGWVMIRASGTEPKIKYYSEIIQEHTTEDKSSECCSQLNQETMNALIHAILEVLLKPSEWL